MSSHLTADEIADLRAAILRRVPDLDPERFDVVAAEGVVDCRYREWRAGAPRTRRVEMQCGATMPRSEATDRLARSIADAWFPLKTILGEVRLMKELIQLQMVDELGATADLIEQRLALHLGERLDDTGRHAAESGTEKRWLDELPR